MRPRKKERIGDFIEVQIAPSVYAYCRLATNMACVFYDFTSEAPIQTTSRLTNKSFLVGLYVMVYATREGHWRIIDQAPLPPEADELTMQPSFLRRGVNSPMTAEHTLRELFAVKGYEDLNPNFPWQGWPE
jgi:hypothetical protein